MTEEGTRTASLRWNQLHSVHAHKVWSESDMWDYYWAQKK